MAIVTLAPSEPLLTMMLPLAVAPKPLQSALVVPLVAQVQLADATSVQFW
jgi:hypothetical protein